MPVFADSHCISNIQALYPLIGKGGETGINPLYTANKPLKTLPLRRSINTAITL